MKVIELAGIGPGPFAAMLLADLGAEVVRIERPTPMPGAIHSSPRFDVLSRGRRSLSLDLKRPNAVAALLRLVERADMLIDPFRPGVAERLGVGPEVCLERNPGLVYGRMTGWGREGAYAGMAGHDINYIALAGALHAIGPRGSDPVLPLNLVGDFGGGGMLLAVGLLAALAERRESGRGQVVDAAMVDGIATLLASLSGLVAGGTWTLERGSNLLDGGCHFYNVYATADGRWISIGCIEPQFYAELLERLGLEPEQWPQHDRARWPELRERLAAVFRTRTRDDWCTMFEGTDVCFAPVLALDEAARHDHLAARGTYVTVDGVEQPAPAPRFSRTPGAIQGAPVERGADSLAVLADWGFSAEEVAELVGG